MRVDPDCPEALALALDVRRSAGNASCGKRVIPAEHHGEAPFVEGSARAARDIRAHVRDGPKETRTALGTARGILAKRDINIPRVVHVMSHLDEAISQIGVAYG